MEEREREGGAGGIEWGREGGREGGREKECGRVNASS